MIIKCEMQIDLSCCNEPTMFVKIHNSNVLRAWCVECYKKYIFEIPLFTDIEKEFYISSRDLNYFNLKFTTI